VSEESDLSHCALFIDVKPITLEEALKEKVWIDVMKSELSVVVKNKT
jgi:hypothetical protein